MNISNFLSLGDNLNISSVLQNFHFLRPMWLIALPLLWLIVFWLARRNNREGDWSQIIDAQLLPALRLDAKTSTGIRPWPWLALTWSLAVLALAGPSWQHIQTTAYRTPGDWIFVLDLSPSMLATDTPPSRVMRARFALNDLLDTARDARVGLVVFSDEPYTVTPLTQDVATVKALLPVLSPDIMPSAGNRLAPALDWAEKLLLQADNNHQRIVVLTDGFEDTSAARSSAAALKAKGITLSVVGVGTQVGAPLRNENGRYATNANGQPRLARLDVEQLQLLGKAGGGNYVDITQLPKLISDLQNAPQSSGDSIAGPGIEITHWQDGGIWLLPFLLLLTGILARRGWL